MSSIVLAFFAGTLSVLSPCVLPVLPVVAASALHRHAHGPLALAAGLLTSSTALGLFFASFGFFVDRDIARLGAGALMAAIGVGLFVPRLQERFQEIVFPMVAPLAERAAALTTRAPATLLGQFVLGMLLGAVWTPCTGPTLAAAVTLATQGEGVAQAGAVMFVFAVGAVVPVLILAYGSRHALVARSDALGAIAAVGKPLMGAALVVIGGLTLSRMDRTVEAWMVDHMPEWLLALTTRL